MCYFLYYGLYDFPKNNHFLFLYVYTEQVAVSASIPPPSLSFLQMLRPCGVHVLVTVTVLYILNYSEPKSNFHHHKSYNCLLLSTREVHLFVNVTALDILNNYDL